MLTSESKDPESQTYDHACAGYCKRTEGNDYGSNFSTFASHAICYYHCKEPALNTFKIVHAGCP